MKGKIARIIGHLQFDGWVANKKHARVFFYGNSNKDLIHEFVKDVRDVFDLNPTIKKDGKIWRVCCHSASVVRELNRISSMPKGTVSHWLRGDRRCQK